MITENQEEVVVPETNEGEAETESDTIAVPKADYEKLNQTLGSLKRELKDLKKSKENSDETPNKKQPEENVLLQRLEGVILQQAELTHQDDIELARNTAKKWGMELEKVVMDEDFKAKLERQQTSRNNIAATSKVRGGQGTNEAKNTPAFWIAKGVPPTPADISDRKTRANIINTMVKNSRTSGKKFYND